VHNFIHQGIADEQFLWATGLCNPTRLRDNLDPAKLNLLKGGIVYSNFVTTVSPTHAWEVSYSDLGRGLGHTLHVHKYKSAGVLDGVDYDVWNPEVDPWIARAYGPDSLEDKYVNKGALRDRFFLRHDSLSSVAPANRPSSNRSL